MTVSKLKNSNVTYKAKLVPFAYFSFAAWIIWGLQSVLLLPTPAVSFLSGSFLSNAGLGLGLMQNALWASAVLCLYPKQLDLKWLSLPVLLMFPIVIASVAFETAILASGIFTFIDLFSGYAIFTGFVLWIFKWRLSKKLGVAFFIHGCFQWLSRYVWFAPLTVPQRATLLMVPIWRVLLLVGWIKLISVIVERAEASLREAVTEIGKRTLDPFHVMIASTVQDLERERDAAEGAILAMHLNRFRAEKLGSVALSPRELCESMSKQCDIFLLIIGERYGHVFEPEGISVVEFEYRVARDEDPGKILVYVKDGVRREDQRLIKFIESVEKFNDGHVIWSFSTPENLAEQIPPDIMRWLTSRVKQKNQKEEPV